jgi:gamma-glutamyltranspeptidase/glutathione hydrolase
MLLLNLIQKILSDWISFFADRLLSNVKKTTCSMRLFFNISLIFLLCSACDFHQPNQKVLGTTTDHAMVSSAHPLASAIGVSVMQDGGNAIDAAIAVHFALAVVYPQAGNIGGGGFAVIRMHDGSSSALDFRETAPSLATKRMYLDENGDLNNKRWSTHGRMSSGVPGAVDGMFSLHKRFGSKSMESLIQPAIDLAKNGYELTFLGAKIINTTQEDFREHNDWPIPYLQKSPWEKGDRILQPELAETLVRIRDEGRNGFYQGKVADQLVTEMQKGKGLISHDDLANYKSVWRTPIAGTYRNHKIISMPPPSSGGVALLQLLQGTEMHPIADWGHNVSETVHLMSELERRVYADRATYVGDPDFVEVPMGQLLDSTYNHQRFADISMKKATPSSTVSAGTITPIESQETTHLSVVDPNGNAMSITTTLNSSFGSKVLVEGAGFFLNNEMDDFSSKPGVPNQFGLIGGDANAIAPHKRMLSSMTPTIVTKNGKLKMVVGTPGGSTIITSVYQTLLNVIDFGMGMQEAVNAKKVHHQWYPDEIRVETNALAQPTIDQLQAMGHSITPTDKLGRMDCILILPDGRLEGGADPRGDNTALGF